MEEEWKRLSEKEFQIMTYIWEENRPLTMNEIREKIGTQGKPANVSTTSSQIRGLIEKGFIRTPRADGKIYGIGVKRSVLQVGTS